MYHHFFSDSGIQQVTNFNFYFFVILSAFPTKSKHTRSVLENNAQSIGKQSICILQI